MSDDTPAERGESFQRTLDRYFGRDWRGMEDDDAAEYWVMNKAKGDIRHATVDPDGRPRR